MPADYSTRTLLKHLGPGLIAGAADDDPSGIATYSQAGAQFGAGMLWTTVLTTPLMIGIQLVSARIGWATGGGIVATLRTHYPRWLMIFVVSLLVVANTINLGADLAAMASAAQLLAGGGHYHIFLLAFALGSLALQIYLPFPRYSPMLKLLTLSLLSYVGILFVGQIDWRSVALDAIVPRIQPTRDYLMMIVAVLGTTISPYLFFWQASQEVEEQRARGDTAARQLDAASASAHLRRIKFDTYFGMTFSNVIAFVIMLTASVALNQHGITDIQTTTQAAEALRPIAGDAAYILFGLGIIGTGMLAVPVLAGASAYAVAEAFGWPIGLAESPRTATGFYAVLAAGFLIGVGLDFNDIDPVKELVWAAVLNGVIAVPIMIVMMLMVQRADIMGPFVARARLRRLGWLATGVMALATIAMGVAMLG